jgi:hypothetical protein
MSWSGEPARMASPYKLFLVQLLSGPTKFRTTTVVKRTLNRTSLLMPNFSASRQKELNDLIEKGGFEIVHTTDVPEGSRIFNSRFVDSIKHAGTDKAFDMLEFCGCALVGDRGHPRFARGHWV